jgi:hypothetical protein
MPKSPVEKAAPFSTLRRYDTDTHSDNPLYLWERAGVRARPMPQSLGKRLRRFPRYGAMTLIPTRTTPSPLGRGLG